MTHCSNQWPADRHKLFLSALVKIGEHVVNKLCWMPHLCNSRFEVIRPKGISHVLDTIRYEDVQYMLSGKEALQPYHARLQHARLPKQAFVHPAMAFFNPMHRTAAYATPLFGSSYLPSLWPYRRWQSLVGFVHSTPRLLSPRICMNYPRLCCI